MEPTDDCRRCRWWRERTRSSWCARADDRGFGSDGRGHFTCDVFEPRRREDFAWMMRDNQDTPRMHT